MASELLMKCRKIELLDYDKLAELADKDAIAAFRAGAMNPDHPRLQGTAQNPDIYFQNREAANKYYDATPAIVEEAMEDFYKAFGRKYNLFDYVGAPDAERVVILMGSGTEAVEETVNYLVFKRRESRSHQSSSLPSVQR